MRQTNVQVSAPGFFGLNTEAAPTDLPPGWCAVADNAIIDASGRIASRKGYRILTSDNTALGGNPITQIHEARYTDGNTVRFATGNNKIFTFDLTGTLTELPTVGITGDNWQIVTLNDDTLFFQRGQAPWIYDNSTSTLSLVTAHPQYVATVPEADCAFSAYGRVWAGGVEGGRGVVYWSDLLIPAAWGMGSAGQLDLTSVWPLGNDEIQAIAAHNQKLIIFGKVSTLVFGSNAPDGLLADPAADLVLEDAIVDIGCVGKYAWTVIGEDLWFVDYTGFRSLGRTIQEKSLPIGDVSKNINTLFRNGARTEDTNTRATFSPDDAFVIVSFPDQTLHYCFDTRAKLEDESARATRWPGLDFTTFGRSADGTLWIGNTDGICQYTGYVDAADSAGNNGRSYRFRYYFHPQTFGEPAKLKVPKEVDFVIGGGLGQRAVCYWGFGYGYQFESQVFVLDSVTPDFYNIDEYNITDPADPTEYGSGSTIGEYQIPLSSSGATMSLGLEADVVGQKLSIQEINIQTKIGRTV